MEPASIRYKNPGAMWGSALAKKWGALPKAVALNDGLGQGNNIAVFPTYVAGICAQLDLWRSSPRYANKRFADAIRTWSGGNYVESYIAFCKSRVPGLNEDTVMDDAFWHGPMAIPFLKAQAWHEAGKQYPATDADWIAARNKVLGVNISTAILAEVPAKTLGQSNIMKGAVTTAGSIAVSGVAKIAETANSTTQTVSVQDIADKVQQASDTITTVKAAQDSAAAIVTTVKPVFGLSPSIWATVAVVSLIVAAGAIGWTMWERYKKLRDQGV